MKRYGDLEKQYLNEVIDSEHLFYVKGEKTESLCQTIKEFFGVEYSAVMSSGTAAIHCAIGALEIPPGYEVITSPITDMGSLIGALYQNLIPVFADVDPETYNITAESIEKVITEKTRAIIVVHLAANPAEMDEIMELAQSKNIPVIEDCAQSYGAKYKDKPVGTFGDIGCYSLNDFKHISSGDGGFIITNNKELYEKTHNFADKCYDRHNLGNKLSYLAPNYRFTELQAAVALAQFSKLPNIIKKRNKFGNMFNEGMKDIPGIIPHKVYPHNLCSYWFTMIKVDPNQVPFGRNEFVGALNFEQVQAGIGYIPRTIYLEKVFTEKAFFPGGIWPAEIIAKREKPIEYKKGLCPIAEKVLEEVIRIPINENMDENKIKQMIQGVKNAYEGIMQDYEDD
jgi:perosamine synthetase